MTRTTLRALAGAALALVAGAAPLLAQPIPVPAVTIYPGDVIREGMLTERDLPDGFAGSGAVVQDRALLVGKTARRTLLPGLPVSANSIGQPKLVSVGAMVRVVFSEGGLTITTYASALQSGAAGDTIPCRNIESGLTVSGTIEADGSVRVGSG